MILFKRSSLSYRLIDSDSSQEGTPRFPLRNLYNRLVPQCKVGRNALSDALKVERARETETETEKLGFLAEGF